MVIGNSLGTFVDFDVNYKSTESMTMRKILVELDLKEWLLESIHIEVEKWKYTWILDYIQVSFQCARCHLYGHVMEDCSINFPNLNEGKLNMSHRGQWRAILS
jgi:hypothetical protein